MEFGEFFGESTSSEQPEETLFSSGRSEDRMIEFGSDSARRCPFFSIFSIKIMFSNFPNDDLGIGSQSPSRGSSGGILISQ